MRDLMVTVMRVTASPYPAAAVQYAVIHASWNNWYDLAEQCRHRVPDPANSRPLPMNQPSRIDLTLGSLKIATPLGIKDYVTYM